MIAYALSAVLGALIMFGPAVAWVAWQQRRSNVHVRVLDPRWEVRIDMTGALEPAAVGKAVHDAIRRHGGAA